jgi:hypothetical protein
MGIYTMTKPTDDTIKAILLHTNGTKQTVQIKKNNIKDIYDLIGCDVFTVVPVAKKSPAGNTGLSVYVDDEGLLKQNSVVNIWSIWLSGFIGYNSPLMGNILLTGPTDIDGYDTDVPDSLAEQIPPTLRPDPELEFFFYSKEN